MSPVFRHGGLRLYLLKLLDEAPRHGYDVIRLLQDKFLGVYSPSPGTIYPRLARLEEEGLVTHETVDGKKVYRITEAGRAELNRRLDDLADLEDELAASVRDIAMEITRDVRETVRNLRDELTWAVREAGRAGRGAGAGPGADGTARTADARPYSGDKPPSADTAARSAAVDAGPGTDAGAGTDESTWRDATAEPDEDITSGQAGPAPEADATDAGARSDADRPRDAEEADGRRTPHDQEDQAGQRESRRGRADWREWAQWAERHDWSEWTDWAKRQGWADWASKQDWKDRAKAASRADWAQWTQTADWLRGSGPRDRRERGGPGGRPAGSAEPGGTGGRPPRPAEPGPDLISDLEHLAAMFAREIRGVAKHAENMGDEAVGNLGRILFDTLNRIRTEVFRAPDPDYPAPPAPDGSDAEPKSGPHPPPGDPPSAS